jgi:hypothetical protein
LLAHAGFDPRRAVQFWEGRAEVSPVTDCVACSGAAFDREVRGKDQSQQQGQQQQQQRTFPLKIVGSGHPMNEVRVEKLRGELDRWRTERERTLAKLHAEAKRGSATEVDPARSRP